MFCHDFKGPGAIPEASWKRCPKRPENIIFLNPVWETILEYIWSQIRFLCIFMVSIFMLIFAIAFGEPPTPISSDLMSFRCPFCCHFAYLLVLLQNCKNETHLERKPCFWGCRPSFAHHCHKLFEVFVVLQSRNIFVWFLQIRASKRGPCSSPFSQFVRFLCDLWDLGLQRCPFLNPVSQFLQIFMKKSVLKLRLEKWSIFGSNLEGVGGRGHCCLAMQILQIFLWISSRHAPPSGVRRILKAAPSAAGPL